MIAGMVSLTCRTAGTRLQGRYRLASRGLASRGLLFADECSLDTHQNRSDRNEGQQRLS
jgi:hypothetical protein